MKKYSNLTMLKISLRHPLSGEKTTLEELLKKIKTFDSAPGGKLDPAIESKRPGKS